MSVFVYLAIATVYLSSIITFIGVYLLLMVLFFVVIISYDDLLVGAPMYSNFGSPIRTLLGRVYVFTSIVSTINILY